MGGKISHCRRCTTAMSEDLSASSHRKEKNRNSSIEEEPRDHNSGSRGRSRILSSRTRKGSSRSSTGSSGGSSRILSRKKRKKEGKIKGRSKSCKDGKSRRIRKCKVKLPDHIQYIPDEESRPDIARGSKLRILYPPTNKWYTAKVKYYSGRNIGKVYVHYEGWSNAWDEWVSIDPKNCEFADEGRRAEEKISHDPEEIDQFHFGFGISSFDEGKTCICSIDKDKAISEDASLLFGEVKPQGVSVMLDEHHLHASSTNTNCLLDLGMGCGKLVLQTFIQFPNITKVIGWELSPSRYDLAKKNLKKFACSRPAGEIILKSDSKSIRAEQILDDKNCRRRRELIFCNGNLFNCTDIQTADIVLLQVQIPVTSYKKLCEFLLKTRPGTRVCSYKSLHKIFSTVNMELPFTQLEINKKPLDTFQATWGQARLLMYTRDGERGIPSCSFHVD